MSPTSLGDLIMKFFHTDLGQFAKTVKADSSLWIDAQDFRY